MVPTIYVPPASRFTDRTPTAYPVLLRALRAGIVLTIEWGTLHIMESVPTWVLVGLTINSLLILGVLESGNWLAFKGRYYFRYSLTALIMVYAAISIAPFFFVVIFTAKGTAGPFPLGWKAICRQSGCRRSLSPRGNPQNDPRSREPERYHSS